jgi:hypothetical protein
MVMMAFLIIAIIAVLVIGLVFKLLKLAIIVALGVGAFVLVRNFIAAKRLK